MTPSQRRELLGAAVRAAEAWHGAHTGGDGEADHKTLIRLMKIALREEFSNHSSKDVELDVDVRSFIRAFYPYGR